MTRERYNCWGTLASIVFAVVSILAALNPHSRVGPWLDHQAWAKVIVAVWAVGPPVFFWVDWVHYLKNEAAEADSRKIAKHTHDLARNIWLGLLAVLSLSFFKITL
jgi:hypothetical protein